MATRAACRRAAHSFGASRPAGRDGNAPRPLWVWLAFAEVPPAATFVGGALMIATLAWHFAGELHATGT
jgi:hypothetical protein